MVRFRKAVLAIPYIISLPIQSNKEADLRTAAYVGDLKKASDLIKFFRVNVNCKDRVSSVLRRP